MKMPPGRGWVITTPAHPISKGLEDYPEIWESRANGRKVTSESQLLSPDNLRKWHDHWHPFGENRGWHIDVSFVVNPCRYSIMRWPEVPRGRGEALWANLESAYSGLSEKIKALINDLQAVHQANALELARKDRKNDVAWSAVHPLVRVHPITGSPCLYVNANATSQILGLREDESNAILALLIKEVMRPEYCLPLVWEDGMVVMWDNQCTAHTGPIKYPDMFPRVVQHMGVAGEKPVGLSGFLSTSLGGGLL